MNKHLLFPPRALFPSTNKHPLFPPLLPKHLATQQHSRACQHMTTQHNLSYQQKRRTSPPSSSSAAPSPPSSQHPLQLRSCQRLSGMRKMTATATTKVALFVRRMSVPRLQGRLPRRRRRNQGWREGLRSNRRPGWAFSGVSDCSYCELFGPNHLRRLLILK